MNNQQAKHYQESKDDCVPGQKALCGLVDVPREKLKDASDVFNEGRQAITCPECNAVHLKALEATYPVNIARAKALAEKQALALTIKAEKRALALTVKAENQARAKAYNDESHARALADRQARKQDKDIDVLKDIRSLLNRIVQYFDSKDKVV